MPKEKDSQPVKWVLLRMRPLLRIFRGFRGSPEAVAGGFSLGLFLALTPTVGIQILIAVFLATVFKLSRPAALLAVMVTNPLTVPPIFTFNYWIGSFFFDGPTVSQVYKHLIQITAEMAKLNFWEVGALLKAFAVTGKDMFLPLIWGSTLVATAAGLTSYVILARLLWFLRLRRERKISLLKMRQENKKDCAPR